MSFIGRGKWVWSSMLGILAVMLIFMLMFRDIVAAALFERAVVQGVEARANATPVSGLKLYMCGTGSPMPDPQRAGACVGVVAGEKAFVFDTGAGSTSRLQRMGFPLGKVEAVFFTHLHMDHIDGIGALLLQSWATTGRQDQTTVYGPVGVGEVIEGFNQAYRIDAGYRVAHHGAAVMPIEGYGATAAPIVRRGNQPVTVYAAEGVTIRAFPVDHGPIEPAFGYRIDHAGRSIVISGDTNFDLRLVAAAKGADVLVHDALQPKLVEAMAQAVEGSGDARLAGILRDTINYHASPEEAARAARGAGVRHLVLYHIVPPVPGRFFHGIFLEDARKAFDGPITVSADGLCLYLPAMSERIEKRGQC